MSVRCTLAFPSIDNSWSFGSPQAVKLTNQLNFSIFQHAQSKQGWQLVLGYSEDPRHREENVGDKREKRPWDIGVLYGRNKIMYKTSRMRIKCA